MNILLIQTTCNSISVEHDTSLIALEPGFDMEYFSLQTKICPKIETECYLECVRYQLAKLGKYNAKSTQIAHQISMVKSFEGNKKTFLKNL